MNAITLTVAPNGRVVIPAAVRISLGIKDGGAVTLREENGRFTLESRTDALRRLQARVAEKVRPHRSLADELIAERRAEESHE